VPPGHRGMMPDHRASCSAGQPRRAATGSPARIRKACRAPQADPDRLCLDGRRRRRAAADRPDGDGAAVWHGSGAPEPACAVAGPHPAGRAGLHTAGLTRAAIDWIGPSYWECIGWQTDTPPARSVACRRRGAGPRQRRAKEEPPSCRTALCRADLPARLPWATRAEEPPYRAGRRPTAPPCLPQGPRAERRRPASAHWHAVPAGFVLRSQQ